jgi:Rhodopirellula transposase DDE domain
MRGFLMAELYSMELEFQMRELYERLSEKDRRQYAAIEALKFSRGGISYIANLFNCSSDTLYVGINEIVSEEKSKGALLRIPGGGRKPVVIKSYETIDLCFLSVIKEHTAGDPMNIEIKWTNLTRKQIGFKLSEFGFFVSRNIVTQLLKKHGYVKRKALKKKPEEVT